MELRQEMSRIHLSTLASTGQNLTRIGYEFFCFVSSSAYLKFMNNLFVVLDSVC